MTVPPDQHDALRRGAVQVVKRLQDAGFTAYWAGGCVRDRIMGKPPVDYDIATRAVPDEVQALFPGAVAVGKSFGVVRVPRGGHEYEVATFRTDHSYGDGRHPDAIEFSDPPTDAQRRDFTMNALFYDPVADAILDFVDGRTDIEAGLIRCVGDPATRFREDHLRLMRAARFAATLDFRIEPATAAAVRDHAHLIKRVAAERVRDELTRILREAPRPGTALRLLHALGLLNHILPEVVAMQGQAQPPQFHPEGDVFEHTVMMLDMLDDRSVHLVYAVLFHDVGKPPTAMQGADRIRFHGHAQCGADMAAAIMRRLRFPSADVEAVTRCIRDHMRTMEVQRMKRSTLRRMVGGETFPVELELHRVDCLASHGGLDNYDFLVAFRDEMAQEPVLPDPWVRGRDVMDMGVPEGPAIGRWLRHAYDAQLENRFPDRASLLEWLSARISHSPDAPGTM